MASKHLDDIRFGNNDDERPPPSSVCPINVSLGAEVGTFRNRSACNTVFPPSMPLFDPSFVEEHTYLMPFSGQPTLFRHPNAIQPCFPVRSPGAKANIKSRYSEPCRYWNYIHPEKITSLQTGREGAQLVSCLWNAFSGAYPLAPLPFPFLLHDEIGLVPWRDSLLLNRCAFDVRVFVRLFQERQGQNGCECEAALLLPTFATGR